MSGARNVVADFLMGGSRSFRNYVKNGLAEQNTLGWTTYADGSAVPVDLTGGSPTATWTRSTSSPLSGDANFLYTAGALGNGVAYTITPDRSDIKRGAVLMGSLELEPSGTIAEGDYTIWVYDVANSVLIQPTGYKVQSGIAGQVYRQMFSFQLPTNGTTFRVAIHQVVSSPANLKVDGFSVGPQIITQGTPSTDWAQYSPTLTGTTTVSGYFEWRRNGPNIFIRGRMALTGSAQAVDISFTAPAGASPDLTGRASGGGDTAGEYPMAGGKAQYGSSNQATQIDGNIQWDSNNSRFYIRTLDRWRTSGTSVPVTTWTTSDTFDVDFSYKVSGWSSNVQMSSDTDTRLVIAKMHSSTTTVGTSPTVIVFSSTDFDTHGALSSGHTFTVPVVGKYRVTCRLQFSAAQTSVARNTMDLNVRKTGVDVERIDYYQFDLTSTTLDPDTDGSTVLDCVAGDTLQITSAKGAGIGTIAVNAGTESYVIFEKLSGPSQIAANEVVACRVGNSSSVLTNNTLVTIVYSTKDFDTHGAYNTSTGQFVVPVAGKYSVSAVLATQPFAAGAVDRIAGVYITQGGSVVRSSFSKYVSKITNSIEHSTDLTDLFNCQAGDTLTIQYAHNLGATPTVNGDGANASFVAIFKVG